MDSPSDTLSLGGTLRQATDIFGVHVGSLLLLCAGGVLFDALLTYVGNAVTFGYGEPVFAMLSVVLQEVLYFGPAVLIWNEIQRRRLVSEAPSTDVLVTTNTLGTLLSGFNSKRAWGVAFQVTLLYFSAFSLLGCLGTVFGGIFLYFVPGGLMLVVKVIRTLIGPIIGAGYLATALAVARPNHGVTDATSGGFRLMVKFPLVAGLVLGVGGFVEQLAGLTVILAVLLDAFMLCYAAALVRQLIDHRQLTADPV